MTFSSKTPISVTLKYDSETGKCLPFHILYKGSYYEVDRLGFHHYYRSGKILIHVFSVTSGKLFFKLSFNTESLNWFLEEMYDAELDE